MATTKTGSQKKRKSIIKRKITGVIKNLKRKRKLK